MCVQITSSNEENREEKMETWANYRCKLKYMHTYLYKSSQEMKNTENESCTWPLCVIRNTLSNRIAVSLYNTICSFS